MLEVYPTGTIQRIGFVDSHFNVFNYSLTANEFELRSSMRFPLASMLFREKFVLRNCQQTETH